MRLKSKDSQQAPFEEVGSGPASSGKRQLSPEKTAAILQGAMQEFLGRGYAATTMDRVAAAAKVSKPTIYNHFQDKQGLFVALIRHLRKEKFNAAFARLNQQGLQGEPEIVLKQLGLAMIATIQSDPKALSFLRLIVAESERFPELAKAFLAESPTASLRMVSHYLTLHPELNLPDVEVAARMYIGTLVHFILFGEVLHGKELLPMEGERLVDGLVFLLTRGRSTAT